MSQPRCQPAHRWMLVALVLLLAGAGLALAACGGAAAPTAAPPIAKGSLDSGRAPAFATSAPALGGLAPTAGPPPAGAPQVATAPSGAGGSPGSLLPLDRKIIKNAQLTETVDQTDIALARITAIASDVGGYVASSHTFSEGDHIGAQVTIAVPADRYEEALNLVRKVAISIESDLSSSSDVSDQYVDLQARLTNLQATADRIRAFLDKAQTVDESLKINAQLSDVEQQIEQIKGQLNVLNARTSFSTITVDLHEQLPTPTPTATPTSTPTPTPIGWHPDQTLNAAVQVQTSLLRSLGDLVIWFIVVLLPYIVLLALVAAGAGWVVRRVSRPSPPRSAA